MKYIPIGIAMLVLAGCQGAGNGIKLDPKACAAAYAKIAELAAKGVSVEVGPILAQFGCKLS